MGDIVRDWFSLNLLGALLWAMYVEIRVLRRKARQQ